MPIFNTYIGDEKEEATKTSLQEIEDQRLRRNIQWGIVRGMFLYTLFMIPIVFVLGLILEALK